MLRMSTMAAAAACVLWAAGARGAEAPAGAAVSLEDYQASLRKALGDDGLPAFAVLDKNQDGKVTPAEFGAERKAAFREFDTDGDGVIQRQECQDAARKRDLLADLVVACMVRWDKNRDGLLDKSEFRGRPGAFVEADEDQNNVLHHAELLALIRNSKPLQYSPARFMQAHDLDGDGLVSHREWLKVEKSEALFAAIDMDHDGTARLPEVETFLFRYERRLAPLPEWEKAEKAPEKAPAPKTREPAKPLKILPDTEPLSETSPGPKIRPLPSDFSETE